MKFSNVLTDASLKAYRNGSMRAEEMSKDELCEIRKYSKFVDLDNTAYPFGYIKLVRSILRSDILILQDIDSKNDVILFSSNNINKLLTESALSIVQCVVLIYSLGLHDGNQRTLAEIADLMEMSIAEVKFNLDTAYHSLCYPSTKHKMIALKFSNIMKFDITDKEASGFKWLERNILNSNLVLGSDSKNKKFDMSKLDKLIAVCERNIEGYSYQKETDIDDSPLGILLWYYHMFPNLKISDSSIPMKSNSYWYSDLFLYEHPEWFPYIDMDGCSFPDNYTRLWRAIFGEKGKENANTNLEFISSCAINKELMRLTPRERLVLVLRFGLIDGRPRSLYEVGKYFDITRERILHIEAKALRKMRHPLITRNILTVKFEDIKKCAVTDEEKAELECLEKDIRNSVLLLGSAATDANFDMSRLALVNKICQREREKKLIEHGLSDSVMLEDLDLSKRTYNSFKRANINTLGDIRNIQDKIDKIRGISKEGVEEVKSLLSNPLDNYIQHYRAKQNEYISVMNVVIKSLDALFGYEEECE